jgi:hypothetical protein
MRRRIDRYIFPEPPGPVFSSAQRHPATPLNFTRLADLTPYLLEQKKRPHVGAASVTERKKSEDQGD